MPSIRLALALVLLPAPPAAARATPAAAVASTADARFRALYTAEWAWRRAQFPQWYREDDAPAAHLSSETPAAQAARLRRWTDTLAALDALDPAALSPAARIDHAVYRDQIAALAAAQRFRDYEMPANADSSFWGDLAGLDPKPFASEREYRDYLGQLGEVPRWFDEQIANMRAGLARGFTPPRVTLEGRDQSIAAIAEAKDPAATGFYAPFRAMPAAIPAARQAALRAAALAAIRTRVIPAYARLLAFWRTTYLPATRTTIAAADLPDGPAYYRAKIREFTTLDMTPDAVHALGLAEVAKIRAEMEQVMRGTGFTGTLPQFLAMLKTDPRFYATTPGQLLREAAWIAKRFDGKAALWFGRLPRSRFGIVAVPDAIAPFYTAARGGKTLYLLNTYDLPSRPLYALPALTLHESAPGHSFQLGLAEEAEDQPEFRRKSYISAYGEGWALYCERLGDEMGMYETPYERFGMLSYQMWRAVRLVVDSGIHAKGWSREKAQAFLRDSTALSDHEVETEIDRYISWPGQALSYYLGAMTIRRARARAEGALGARFDIRAFHDTVLALGSVPLPVLEARIDRFIAEGGRGPYPSR